MRIASFASFAVSCSRFGGGQLSKILFFCRWSGPFSADYSNPSRFLVEMNSYHFTGHRNQNTLEKQDP